MLVMKAAGSLSALVGPNEGAELVAVAGFLRKAGKHSSFDSLR